MRKYLLYLSLIAMFGLCCNITAAEQKSDLQSPLNGIYEDSRRISLRDNPKANGLNMEIIVPYGWQPSVSNNKHTVAHYMYGAGVKQLSYMVQVYDLPTFISRGEAKKIFSGNEKYGITRENLLSDFTGDILYSNEEQVAQYPALKVKMTMKQRIVGQDHLMYVNLWMVIVEDHMVMIWGTSLDPTNRDKNLCDTLFATLVGVVRFPDLFE